MGGILDALRMAVPGVAAARLGYQQGQTAEADKQEQTQRQSIVDKLKDAMQQAQVDETRARADYYRGGGGAGGGASVTWKQGPDGEYIALPTKLPGPKSTVSTSASSGASLTRIPTIPQNADSSVSETPGPQDPQAPTPRTPPMGVRSGVKAPAKSHASEPLVQVQAPDGSVTYAPRSQAAGQKVPTKTSSASTEPLVRVQQPDGSVKYIKRSQAAGMEAPTSAGGMSGGMGSGGIGGVARQASAITELNLAHEQMLPFEESVRSGKASYDGLDYWKGLRAKMYDAHGVIDQGVHAKVLADLDESNPDLANYLRAAEGWALADGQISGKSSDFRTKLDGFVSQIGPRSKPTAINNVQRMRSTRLDELKKFQPAMEATADRMAAGAQGRGRGGAPTATAPTGRGSAATTPTGGASSGGNNAFAHLIPKKPDGDEDEYE